MVFPKDRAGFMLSGALKGTRLRLLKMRRKPYDH